MCDFSIAQPFFNNFSFCDGLGCENECTFDTVEEEED
jgi:hypothetical protein